MPTMRLSGLRPHPIRAQRWMGYTFLKCSAKVRGSKPVSAEDRAVLVPFALLQGAPPLEVAEALSRWTRNELSGAIARWAATLRRDRRDRPGRARPSPRSQYR